MAIRSHRRFRAGMCLLLLFVWTLGFNLVKADSANAAAGPLKARTFCAYKDAGYKGTKWCYGDGGGRCFSAIVKNQWSSLHTYNYKQRVPGTLFGHYNTWQLVLYNHDGCKDEITSFGPDNRYDDDNFRWSADGDSNDQANSFRVFQRS